MLKQIQSNSSNKSSEYQTLPSLNDLDKHYKNLLQKDCNLTKQDFPEPLNTKPIDSLNQNITIQEIKESINYLKTKKTPGLDNIRNEMIKCSDRNMIEHPQTLFNDIMESGYYPTSWNQGLICSIYKSGKKDDPNNYMGITLSNCLGKLFNTILYNRLQNELQKNIVLSPTQAGFRKDNRTSDHIFTLFSLIYKYIKKGKYLYTCFVDFQKAYHSIRRDSLKQKLEQVGIKGNLVDIITSIYSSTKVSLSYNSYVSTPFSTFIGLKQGDILSIIFFNLFINDLPMLLEKHSTQSEESKPPELFNTEINSLLFANDLAIFSLTKNELQEKLDFLEKYCRQWDLSLNLKKTKVIIFNKQGNTIKKNYILL